MINQNKKGLSAWIWILIVLALILIGLGIWFWLSKGSGASNVSGINTNSIPQPPALPPL